MFCHISKFGNLTFFVVIKSKLGQKGVKFVYCIPSVIKRSNSVTMVFSSLVIHFCDHSLKLGIMAHC